MDNEFGLKKLSDEAEQKAIKHAIQSHSERVLFLSNDEENNTDNLVAFRLNDEWTVRKYSDEISTEKLSHLLHYTMKAADSVNRSEGNNSYGDYYSLRPLIYGGEYWLESVCRQEFNRYQDLKESQILSVIVIPWKSEWSLFDLVEELRRGDRIGYFDNILGILLPFTNENQMTTVAGRLEETFELSDVYCWLAERDFENLHELTSQVRELR